VLDHLVSDTDSENPKLVAYLGFDLDGAYQGVSWYFGSGDGCGYCSSGKITSTVRISGGRLVGTVKGTEDDYAIDLDLDIPVQIEQPGTPAPLDSEPAQALRAFHAELMSAEHGALWDRLDSEWKEILDGQTPEQLESFYSSLQTEHLPVDLQVREVYLEGDRALVVFEGKASYGGDLHGEARMDREEGVWKYDDAWLDVKLE
jgi:hypothetical protein